MGLSTWMKPLRGLVIVELDGREAYRTENLFVADGYGRIASYLAGLAPRAPSHLAVGNGDGSASGVAVSPAVGDHTLGFELLRVPIGSQSVQSIYSVRIVGVFDATVVQRPVTEVALFDAGGDSGTATSGTTTTLTDTTKAWIANQWVGCTVYLTGGTGSGQKSVITSNTATQLTFGAMTTAPDSTTKYTIGGVASSAAAGGQTYMFARAAISVNKGAQSMNVIWQISPTF
jgi:hypothetical protein